MLMYAQSADSQAGLTAAEAYGTLRLPRHATNAEVRRAYRQAALDVHPDKSFGSSRQFQRVRIAFEVLSDPKRRAALDADGTDVEDRPQPHLHALGDAGAWVIERRFGTWNDAGAFVRRCQ